MKARTEQHSKRTSTANARLNVGGFDTSANKRTWPRQFEGKQETRFAARAVAQVVEANKP